MERNRFFYTRIRNHWTVFDTFAGISEMVGQAATEIQAYNCTRRLNRAETDESIERHSRHLRRLWHNR